MKKYLYLFICLTTLLAIIFLMILLPDINFKIYTPYINKSLTFNLSQYSLLLFALSYVSALFFSMLYLLKRNSLISSYEKRYEKMSVNKDESEHQIKILENKVKTLEAALKQALNKNK